MFYHYCTYLDNTEISHTPIREDGSVIIHIEEPHEITDFKTLEIEIPTLGTIKNSGFSKKEVDFWRMFCNDNACLIFELAQKGGIHNAVHTNCTRL